MPHTMPQLNCMQQIDALHTANSANDGMVWTHAQNKDSDNGTREIHLSRSYVPAHTHSCRVTSSQVSRQSQKKHLNTFQFQWCVGDSGKQLTFARHVKIRALRKEFARGKKLAILALRNWSTTTIVEADIFGQLVVFSIVQSLVIRFSVTRFTGPEQWIALTRSIRSWTQSTRKQQIYAIKYVTVSIDIVVSRASRCRASSSVSTAVADHSSYSI